MKYVDDVIQNLSQTVHDAEIPVTKKIHKLRLTTKRLRSLWRLLRKEAGQPAYREENSRLREISRRYADLRDQEIVAKLVRKLKNKNRGRGLHQEFKRVQHSVDQRLQRAAVSAAQWDLLLREVRTSAARLEGFKLNGKWLRRQIERSIKHSKRELRHCLRVNSDPEDFHRWRRRTKNLMYQIEFVNSLGLNFADKSLGDLKALSDDLGDAHDHQILYEFLVREKASKKARREAQHKQRELEQKSLSNGQCLRHLH